jgi:hypothetical protein
MSLQGDLPSYEVVHEILAQHITALEDLNANEHIPSLREAEQSLEHQFVKASELATALEGQLEHFQGQKGYLEAEIQAHADWIMQIREKLRMIDDISGSDDILIKTLETAKVS